MYNKLHTGFVPFPTSNVTFSSGDLVGTLSTGNAALRAIFGKASGKWYFEVTFNSYDANHSVGLFNPETAVNFGPGASTLKEDFGFVTNGNKRTLNASSAYGSSWTTETIGVYWDADNGRIFFSVSGTVQNSGDPVSGANPAFSGISSGTVLIPGCLVSGAGNYATFNFGESSFTYTPVGSFEGYTDDKTSYSYSYKKNNNNAVYGNAGCDAFDSSWDSSHSFGYPGSSNGPYDGYFQIDKIHLSTSNTILSARVGFIVNASESTANCQVSISAEKTISPTEPTDCASLATAILNQTAKTSWNPGTWVYSGGSVEYTSDIALIIRELIALPSWAYGSEILLLYEDNGSTVTHNRSFTWNQNNPHVFILEIEYKSGAPATYAPTDVEIAGVSDESTVNTESAVSGDDDIGVSDVSDASPYFFEETETIGIGDASDAEIQNVTAQDDIGVADESDAFSLSPIGEDDIGVSDESDAYSLSPTAQDDIGVSDESDATATKIFSIGPVYFPKRIRGADIVVTEFPIMSFTGGIPSPAGEFNGGMVFNGGLPVPVGEFGVEIDNIISFHGNLPLPAGTFNATIDNILSFDKGIPVPSGRFELIRDKVFTFDGALPPPSGEFSGGTEPVVEFSGGLPIPGGGFEMGISGRFGILEHSRC